MRQLTVLIVIVSMLLTSMPVQAAKIIPHKDLTYMGAFQLPQGNQGVSSYGYGGLGMTWNPAGNGGAGSLFISANPQYQGIGEVSIPALKTVTMSTINTLNTATALQSVTDITNGALASYYTTTGHGATIPSISITYIPAKGAMSSPRLFWSLGDNYDARSITGWSSTTNWSGGVTADSKWFLSGSFPGGSCTYFGISYAPAGVACGAEYEQYSFLAPQSWADSYTSGKSLLVGSNSPNQSGNVQPALYAIAPWTVDHPSDNAIFTNTKLAKYNFGDYPDHYAHSSGVWSGAFVTVGSKQAIIFSGKRSLREENAAVTDAPGYTFPNLRWPFEVYKGSGTGTGSNAGNGHDYCPECDQYGVNNGGYQGFPSFGQLSFYDPADYVDVINGVKQPNEPRSYATLNLKSFFLSPPPTQGLQNGAGGIAYDPVGQNIYVAELYAFTSGGYPVIHVFHISDSGINSLDTTAPTPPADVVNTSGSLSWSASTSPVGGVAYAILKNYDSTGNAYATGARITGNFWKPIAFTRDTFWVDPYYNSGIELSNGYQIVAIDALMNYSLDYSGGVVNGACGSANGITPLSVPQENLCSSGAATEVTGHFAWSCTGVAGGSTATCYTAPTTTANKAAGRYTIRPRPTLSCASEGTCASTVFCLDFTNSCNPTTTYTGAIESLLMNTAGPQYLRFKSTDTATNAETVQSLMFRKQKRR